MKTGIIKNEMEYDAALKRLNEIFDAPLNTAQGEEAELLSLLIEDYEQKHYSIDPPDPIEAIRIRMEQMNLKQSDMYEIIGGKNRVSEVLNRKRKLTLDMIRRLTSRLRIPPKVLIQDYQVTQTE